MNADDIFESEGELELVEPADLTADDIDAIFAGMAGSGA